MTDSTTIRRRLVDEGLLKLLVDEVRFPVGLGEIPTEVDLEDPKYVYARIDAADRVGESTGPPFAPEADGDVEYDVRVCAGLGRGRDGCQWAADEVVRVMGTREPWGYPRYPLDAEKHSEMDRSLPGGFPAATLRDGVWQATISVRLTVTRIPEEAS